MMIAMMTAMAWCDWVRPFSIVVRIDSWDVTSRYPNGHYVRLIGPVLELDTEVEADMLETGLEGALAALCPLLFHVSCRTLHISLSICSHHCFHLFVRVHGRRGLLLLLLLLLLLCWLLLCASCQPPPGHLRPFPAAALRCLPFLSPGVPWEPAAVEVERRRDLRATHTVCSVDPPGCTDIDDALSFHRLPNGHLQFGVHIADVTAFVKHGSALDLEARQRSTTVYLVDRRMDMLPSMLSEVLCSLRSGMFCDAERTAAWLMRQQAAMSMASVHM